jgi:hypothetical protein
MILHQLASYAYILLFITSTGMLLFRDWRMVIALYAIQYIGVLILLGNSWPFGLAGITLVVGWMTAVALGTTQIGQNSLIDEHGQFTNRIFRLLAASLIIILNYSVAPKVIIWLPGASFPVVFGSLILIASGLLQLGMTINAFRVIIGLLTILAGFEVLYAIVESSVLVIGLLAAINLGLAFVGSYFLSIAPPEKPA